MSYFVVTCYSLAWFLITIVADMFILTAMVTPKWLIGPVPYVIESNESNMTVQRFPSLGINTRCVLMNKQTFHCGIFDLDGLTTYNAVYPLPWKVSKMFIATGFMIMTITIFLTVISCCRQSIFGKSIHTVTGSAQAIAAISVLIALFVHPFAWGHNRVQRLCGEDSSAFWPSDCTLGWSLYCAVIGIFLGFICAAISLKAESANMNSNIRRRIEGGERFLCVP